MKGQKKREYKGGREKRTDKYLHIFPLKVIIRHISRILN